MSVVSVSNRHFEGGIHAEEMERKQGGETDFKMPSQRKRRRSTQEKKGLGETAWALKENSGPVEEKEVVSFPFHVLARGRHFAGLSCFYLLHYRGRFDSSELSELGRNINR